MKVEPTPEQIRDLKNQSNDAILMFFDEGWYNAFDDDAYRLVEMLKLRLFQGRPPRPRVWFHETDLERYLAILVAAGCRLALVGKVQGEQVVHKFSEVAR